MAKIAAAVQEAVARRRASGGPGGVTPRVIARGEGWSAADVLCTSGPADRSFEEQHSHWTIALVVAGTFQYRTARRALMTPGSMLLGTCGQCYECGHEHGVGDRCVSFWYAPEHFERLAADAGWRGDRGLFAAGRLPPVRALSPLAVRVARGLVAPQALAWDELAIELAANVVQVAGGINPPATRPPVNAEARVTGIVRAIDREIRAGSAGSLSLAALSRRAALSPWHFLRTFERVTGVTPHQYILRARLRRAALRLCDEPARVLDIALEAGFGDASNFNRAFRAEFGVSPRMYRRLA